MFKYSKTATFFWFLIIDSIVLCENITAGANDEGTLIFAQILFRHGDRNPINTYPNDPWKDSKHWLEGFGQLSKAGVKKQYELGDFLRRRYEHLIPEDIFPNNLIYVQSTDFDRTIMSAQAALAGFFAPTESQIWNNKLLWQPVAVHTVPKSLDYVLVANFRVVTQKPCPLYQDLLKKNLETDAYQMWRLKYKWIYDYLEEHSGKTFESPKDLIHLHDTLKIQKQSGKAIPDWADSVYNEIEMLSNFEDRCATGTREMSRLKSGYLIREIFERFRNRTRGPLIPDRKFWMYSGHDLTMANLMNALGFPENTNVPYSATVLFELYELNGEYYVQFFYKNTNYENLPPLNIPGCGIKCPIDKLFEVYESIIPTQDLETECKL